MCMSRGLKTETFFTPAAFSATIPNLCFNSAPINLMGIATGSTYGAWSGQNVFSNTFTPSGLQTGIYTLKYTRVSSPNPICVDTNFIAVSVLNPPIPIITQVGPYCSKAGAIQLSVTPNTGVWTSFGYVT